MLSIVQKYYCICHLKQLLKITTHRSLILLSAHSIIHFI